MSDDTHRVEFIANPTQRRFIESRAEADLFDCRKGEGKSAGLVWSCAYHTMKNPGATWLIIRDTWENLRRTTLQEFFHWFAPGVYGEWYAGDKEFIWNAARTGIKGKVIFLGVDDDSSATKIASMPLAGVAIDEPSPAAGEGGVSEFVLDTALAQLRQPGMNWYAAKLAQNNPDELHWTYRRFWDPGTPATDEAELPPMQESGFKAWQTREPENVHHLPDGYYERLGRQWAHRPDLYRRFVEGKHGYQQVGSAVTTEWSDDLHLTRGLKPVKGVDLQLLYDGGLNPTCVITQVTPLGDWLILESHVGDSIGMYELIEDVIKPRLTTAYKGFDWRHIGDPSLKNREQSSSMASAAKLITRELGGPFIPGPVHEEPRIDPLRAVLRKSREGRGIVRVDRDNAREIWQALRGGWHRHVSRNGVVGNIVKDRHSHPADAMSYGAAILFPLGKLREKKNHARPQSASYFRGLGFERPGAKVPQSGQKL